MHRRGSCQNMLQIVCKRATERLMGNSIDQYSGSYHLYHLGFLADDYKNHRDTSWPTSICHGSCCTHQLRILRSSMIRWGRVACAVCQVGLWPEIVATILYFYLLHYLDSLKGRDAVR